MKIWKRIKLGTGIKTGREFYDLLKRCGWEISSSAKKALYKRKFVVSCTERKVNLVRVTDIDLGLSKESPPKVVYKRAIELGLELCPYEVGPQLRMQYGNQPTNEWLLIATDKIVTGQFSVGVFVVGRSPESSWLADSDMADIWNHASRYVKYWVFVKPSKKNRKK